MNSLAGQDCFEKPALKRIFALLNADGGEVRIVGGAVRNALMGLPVVDIDMATTLTPDVVVARAKAAGIKAVPTGIEHGTVTLVIDGEGFEVTTLRRDVETNGRHAQVAFGSDWQTDAERRDLTINALYADEKGEIIDLINGLPDIETGTVRFIGDAATRISEDYLRILRFFRFFCPLWLWPPGCRWLASQRTGQGQAGDAFGRAGVERVEKAAFSPRSVPRPALDAAIGRSNGNSSRNREVGYRRHSRSGRDGAGSWLGGGSNAAACRDRAAG